MSEDLDELYQDVILDHFKHPRCHGELEEPDATQKLFNPLCGDQVCVAIKLEGTNVSDVKFVGKGCSISQASASMMADLCKGKSREEIEKIISSFRAMMRNEVEPEVIEDLIDDAISLKGVRKFTSRIKCAVLAWEAMEKCLASLNKPGN